MIRDLSLTIEDGESVALMGPSGSGKSTALQLIGGLLRPTRGDIQYLRSCEVVRDAPRIGWVFQTNNVLSRRSAADNAALGLLAGGMSHAPARERAYRMLQAMGISHLADRALKTLSGGEVQRVCIARALAPAPDLVLADEPTGQLDSATTSSVVRALFDHLPPKSSLIVATHDVEVAQKCGQVFILRDGSLHQAAEVR